MATGKLSALLITKSCFAVRSVSKNSNGTDSVILLKMSLELSGLTLINFDGVVESSIYCVAAVFEKLGILHVLPRL